MRMRFVAAVFTALLIAASLTTSHGPAFGPAFAAGAHGPTGASPADATTPEEKMQRRFPQLVKVGDLIGSRVLDYDDITLGYVRQVVRTPQGKILLIVSYGGWLGFGTRPVAVPIEVVALIGRNVAALDMPPTEFSAAPTWPGQGADAVPSDEIIKIAITRR